MSGSDKLYENRGEIGVDTLNFNNKPIYSINTLLGFYRPLNIPKGIYKLEDVEHRINYNARNIDFNISHYRQNGCFDSKFKDKYSKNYPRRYKYNKTTNNSPNKNLLECSWREYDKPFNLGFNRLSISSDVTEHENSNNHIIEKTITNELESNRNKFFSSETKLDQSYNTSHLNNRTGNVNSIPSEIGGSKYSNMVLEDYFKEKHSLNVMQNVVNDNSGINNNNGGLTNGMIHFNENIVNELIDNRHLHCDITTNNNKNTYKIGSNSYLYGIMENNAINSGISNNVNINDYYFEVGNINDNNLGKLNENNGISYVSKEDRLNKINNNIINTSSNINNYNSIFNRDNYYKINADNNGIQCKNKEFPVFGDQIMNTSMSTMVDDVQNDLDKPLWFFKEVNSTIIHGPYSTNEMKNLSDNCKITINALLFSTINKRIWHPLDSYYPYLKSIFQYIPGNCFDKNSVSIVNTTKKEEKNDIETIITNVSNFNLEENNFNIASKSDTISSNLDTQINNDGQVFKKDQEPKLGAIENNELDFDSNDCNGKNTPTIIDSNDDKLIEVNSDLVINFDSIQKNSKKPAWNISNEEGKKRVIVNFENILKEEKNSFENILQKNVRVGSNDGILDKSDKSNITKGWKKINTDIQIHSLNPYENLEETSTKVKKEINLLAINNQIVNNVSLNSMSKYSAKSGWKGWGNTSYKKQNIKNTDSPIDKTKFSLINVNNHNDDKGFWDLCRSYNTDNVIDNNKINVESSMDNNEELKLNIKDNKVISSQVSKNRKKKGIKIDSSLLSFGIRSDRPRNLNYDLD
ncbi:hypothetical protein FG379_001128 [Cryptosporidium bovis]|uniref:uncharacterized protein n=1 Tax=Cryptosporidium bovis TaxID=310047 RepID=UPI00351A99EC|nr:hypothetical protein FG379_001128 [Cryptosporidium bovis]